MNKELKIIKLLTEFPIGGISQNREELLCKASIVTYLAGLQDSTKSIQEEEVKRFIGDILALEGEETIPSLPEAERKLRLSPGFLQDWNKVQLTRENHPGFDEIFNIIADSLSLVKDDTKVI